MFNKSQILFLLVNTFKRPVYAGSCIATVKSNDSVKLITVDLQHLIQLLLIILIYQQNLSMLQIRNISEFVSEELGKVIDQN